MSRAGDVLRTWRAVAHHPTRRVIPSAVVPARRERAGSPVGQMRALPSVLGAAGKGISNAGPATRCSYRPMTGTATFGPKIDVRGQFERTRASLLRLLNTLEPDDWERPTAAAPWTVRDLAAHMLGDDLNRLSRSRDDHSGDEPAPGEALPEFLHRINDEWVRAAARISPAAIVTLLEATTPQVLAFWHSVDLDALGEPVTWAGPDPAPVWLDCARDFTEYWVHQEQIHEAIGRIEPDVPEGAHAVLDTFLRAMPYTLEGCDRPEGTTVRVHVDGPSGGHWVWRYEDDRWRPTEHSVDRGTVVRFGDADSLWRLCTRMLSPADAGRRVVVTGDRELAERALQIVSIIR
jgi:uncharacterized protein (TIGR03083 family)